MVFMQPKLILSLWSLQRFEGRKIVNIQKSACVIQTLQKHFNNNTFASTFQVRVDSSAPASGDAFHV